MEIKYSKKKQEMRKDLFFDLVNNSKDFTEKNSKTLVSIGIALLIVLIGLFGYRYINAANEQKTQDSFGKAMVAYSTGDEVRAMEALKYVVDNHKGSAQAVYSAFILGNVYLQGGKFDEAINWFNQASSKNAETGFVGAGALEGLATCYAEKGNREESIKYLQQALTDERIRYRFPELAWKAALLSKDMGKLTEAKKYCEQIVNDTTSQAKEFKQKAENVLTEIMVLQKS